MYKSNGQHPDDYVKNGIIALPSVNVDQIIDIGIRQMEELEKNHQMPSLTSFI